MISTTTQFIRTKINLLEPLVVRTQSSRGIVGRNRPLPAA